MVNRKRYNKEQQILAGIYESSLRVSMTALMIVAVLEIVMLVYSVANPALYKGSQGRYRIFYIVLLSVALIYMGLNMYVRKNLQKRYALLNVANPLCAVIFFAWSLGITISDIQLHHVVDPSVFMTFSLTVPLSFYLRPRVYAGIALVADAGILFLTAFYSGFGAVFINLSLFIVFQFVLGISFLRMRTDLAKSVQEEKEIAFIDAMTGFFNRRAYMEDLESLAKDRLHRDFVYFAIDINGLKEVNDVQGHEKGDKLISGAAYCMEQVFGEAGTLYRVGGDEFVVLAHIEHDKVDKLLEEYDRLQEEWSRKNGMVLACAYGYAYFHEHPGMNADEIARTADERMYEAKARYYQQTGKNRRKR